MLVDLFRYGHNRFSRLQSFEDFCEMLEDAALLQSFSQITHYTHENS